MNESNKYTILFVEDAALNFGKMAVKTIKNSTLLLDFLKTNSKIIIPVSNIVIDKIDVLWAKNCYDAITKYIDNKNKGLDKINLILMDFDLSYEYSVADKTKASSDSAIGTIIEYNDENKDFCKNPDTMDDDDKIKMVDENNGCNTAKYIRELGYKGPIIPVSVNNSYFGLFKKQICGNWFVENENDIPTEKVNIKYFLPFLIKQLKKYYKIDETIPYLESINVNIDDETPMLDLSRNPQSSVSIKQDISPSLTPKPVFSLGSKKIVPLITNIDELQQTPGFKLFSKIAVPVIKTNPTVRLGSNIVAPLIHNIDEQLQNSSIQNKPKGGKKTKKLHKKLHKKQRKTKKRILGRHRKTNRIK